MQVVAAVVVAGGVLLVAAVALGAAAREARSEAVSPETRLPARVTRRARAARSNPPQR